MLRKRTWIMVLLLALILICGVLFFSVFREGDGAAGEEVSFTMPDLAGYTFEEAESRLRKVNPDFALVREDIASGIFPEGYVMEQVPEPGGQVKIDTECILRVSKGAAAGENINTEHIEASEPLSDVSLDDIVYMGFVTILDSPFHEGGKGGIRLELKQSGGSNIVFEEQLDSSDFPLTVSVKGQEPGLGIVSMYVDGIIYEDTFAVTLVSQPAKP